MAASDATTAQTAGSVANVLLKCGDSNGFYDKMKEGLVPDLSDRRLVGSSGYTASYFIPPEHLAKTVGTKLFYPCAGRDVIEPTMIFGPFVSELWFGDLAYPAGLRMDPVFGRSSNNGYILKEVKITGNPEAVLQLRDGYRFLPPSKRIETYQRQDGSALHIVRRRGFDEIALGAEFPDDSIGVFFYRGDGGGEGGSGIEFFGNRRKKYPPLQNLFSLLLRKLTKPALIVTDGSNCGKSSGLPIARFFNSSISSKDAFIMCAGQIWSVGGIQWRCVGFAGRRYGPTLVWAVAPS
jgi:hypothetical protein